MGCRPSSRAADARRIFPWAMERTMRRFALPVSMLLLLVAPMVWADEPKHGGQVKKIGPYEAELVVKGPNVQLYVIKDHKPMAPSAGMASAVRLSVNNAEQAIQLAPEGEKLAGKASGPVKGSVRAMATLTENGKEIGKAQYSVTAK